MSVFVLEDSERGIEGKHTCFISCFIFKPAPYQAPVAVTAAILPVSTKRRKVANCGVDMIDFPEDGYGSSRM